MSSPIVLWWRNMKIIIPIPHILINFLVIIIRDFCSYSCYRLISVFRTNTSYVLSASKSSFLRSTLSCCLVSMLFVLYLSCWVGRSKFICSYFLWFSSSSGSWFPWASFTSFWSLNKLMTFRRASGWNILNSISLNFSSFIIMLTFWILFHFK